MCNLHINLLIMEPFDNVIWQNSICQYPPVHFGYASFRSHTLDTTKFKFYKIPYWIIAVEVDKSMDEVKNIIHSIQIKGVANSDYAKIGDMLVPRYLDFSERRTLADACLNC